MSTVDVNGLIKLDDGIMAGGIYATRRPRVRNTCDARIRFYPPNRHIASGPDYGWCGERGEWKRGDQRLCGFHLGILVGGGNVCGINTDGKWS